MAYTARVLEDSANWTIVTKHLRAKLARVIIDDKQGVVPYLPLNEVGKQSTTQAAKPVTATQPEAK